MITPEEPLRLETVGVLRNGRRRYDPASKQRLVEACLQPGDVEQSMGLDPFQRAVFAFCNRRRDRIKLLIYDRSGFWMLLKRLEADRFHWPRSQEAVLTLTTEELHWLLDGINIAAVRRHPVRQYQSVG